MRRFSLLFVGIVFSLAAFAGESYTITRIIDGDTIRVWDGMKEHPVRLIGVDTPEISLNQKAVKDGLAWDVAVGDIIQAGKVARAYVISVAPPGSEVRIVTGSRVTDMYGRILAYVYLSDGQCLNEVLIREGYGIAPRQYSHRERKRYIAIEDDARQHRRGFWRTLWTRTEIR